jgi:ribosomal protein S18 acetylase RimI-like enzyme
MAAFVGMKMIGACTVRRREPKDIRHTGLLGVTVLEDYRGVGVGERLITEVLKAAYRIGIWLIELEAITVNESAIHLYEKVGFRKVGVVPSKFIRNGRHLDTLLMYIDLRGTDKSLLRR